MLEKIYGMYHALIEDIKWETLQKSRMMKNYVISPYSMRLCSMQHGQYFKCKKTFFLSFELNKLQEKIS